MCSRYLLRISYDGSRFAEMAKGNTGCGILHQLENVILYTLGKDSDMKVVCSPSSRTDKGVHALNNAILMKVYPKYDINSNKKEFLNKFNSIIDIVSPNGMKIIDCTEVSPGFCERRHVSYRIYTYRLAIAKDYDIYKGYKESTSLAYMSEKNYAWILPPGFDTGKAQEACNMFRGLHNMASFFKHSKYNRQREIAKNISSKNTWKYIYLLQVGAGKAKSFENDLFDYVNVSIVSRSFIRQQIRKMISVITLYGYGRMEKSTIKYLLERPEPCNFFNMNIPVAPPQGLFLTDVVYDPSLYMEPIPYYNDELNSVELDDKL